MNAEAKATPLNMERVVNVEEYQKAFTSKRELLRTPAGRSEIIKEVNQQHFPPPKAAPKLRSPRIRAKKKDQ